VTRIIAGFAGSLTLGVPKTGTRPTSDRVREALFSSLESRDGVFGARVVDLYAGTGALGLEAASRGASHVTLVEKVASAARVARGNAGLVLARAAAGTGPAPVIEVAVQPVRTFLAQAAVGVDLVFVDPPYELSGDDLAGDLAGVARILGPGGLLIVERAARTGEPAWPDGITLDMKKSYGDTVLWWGRAGD